ncbi:MAG: ParB/RepB/Spo0J family partition protein [Anaerolineae bacterium]|nr:ParB/RepB/Spo0J family partition protein [Anaerolineae bacterium]
MSQKRGLGRGLASLIPADEESKDGLQTVPLERITPNPHQPRSAIRDEDLEELAASIREHGIIQPLVVTRGSDQGYQLIAGERRWRAARLAGLTELPVVVKEVAPQQMLELALVENIQREDLNALEEALAYQQLVDGFGFSHAQVAERVGKSRVAITNTLRLLQASPAIQEAVLEKEIAEGHARALLGLNTHEEQDSALEIVLHQGLNVRQTETLVQTMRSGKKPKSPAAPPAPEVRALEERFQESLGTRVNLRPASKGGRIVIYYYSDEEFRSLYEHLTGEDL